MSWEVTLSALMLGLLGGFHCLGMCGPIAFALPLPGRGKASRLAFSLLYQAGRITTYALIGALFGVFGKGLQLAGFQQRLSILIGVIMLVLLFTPRLKLGDKVNSEMFGLVSWLKKKMGFYLRKRSASTLWVLGMLNGLLPCGLVYMALFGAVSAGSPVYGAQFMALFGLGTLPLMLGAIFTINSVSLNLRRKVQAFIPVLVAVVAVLFILRGLDLNIPYISPSEASLQLGNSAATCH